MHCIACGTAGTVKAGDDAGRDPVPSGGRGTGPVGVGSGSVMLPVTTAAPASAEVARSSRSVVCGDGRRPPACVVGRNEACEDEVRVLCVIAGAHHTAERKACALSARISASMAVRTATAFALAKAALAWAAATSASAAATSASALAIMRRDWAANVVARSISAPPVGDEMRAVGTVGTAASTVSTGTLARVEDSMRSKSGENSPREASCDDMAEKLRRKDAVVR